MPRPRLAKLDPVVHRRILDAARHEFSTHGYDKASLNTIIEQAGISKGVLYYYFEDKADLYLAIFQDARESLAKIFGILEAGEPTGDFWQDLKTIIRHRTKQRLANPELVKLLQDLFLQAQKPGPNPFRALYEEEQEWSAKYLESGIALGLIRTDLPPDFLLDVSFTVDDVLSRHLLREFDNATEEDIERFTELLLDVIQRIAATDPAQP